MSKDPKTALQRNIPSLELVWVHKGAFGSGMARNIQNERVRGFE